MIRVTKITPDSEDHHVVVPKKFDRNARLWGRSGVERLANAHVMVLGLGGVGSYAAEGLVRSGVGRLTLVDFDEVCVTNINRQVPALPSTIGTSKSELMAERCKAINPDVNVNGIKAFYNKDTAETLLREPPDFLVDCIDNITAKTHLIVNCLHRNIPMVTCLGASAKVDPTRIKVATLARTHTDRLARAVRDALQRTHGIETATMEKVLAVFSDEPIIWPNADFKTSLCGITCLCPNKSNEHHTCEKRSVIHGSAVFVTSVFGMIAVSVAIRHLTGIGTLRLEGSAYKRGKKHKAPTK